MTVKLCTNEQIEEVNKYVKIEYNKDENCGQLVINGRVFTVKESDKSKKEALNEEEWKQVATKVAYMLIQKNLLNDKFAGAEINDKGITSLPDRKVFIPHADGKDTARDYQDLSNFLATKIFKGPEKKEPPYTIPTISVTSKNKPEEPNKQKIDKVACPKLETVVIPNPVKPAPENVKPNNEATKKLNAEQQKIADEKAFQEYKKGLEDWEKSYNDSKEKENIKEQHLAKLKHLIAALEKQVKNEAILAEGKEMYNKLVAKMNPQNLKKD